MADTWLPVGVSDDDMPTGSRAGVTHALSFIITGGASSLSSCAVQLLASAGYDVVST
jgi:NADPH:quinone reductase-like Zn-dependent oxidoreductase